MKQGHMSDHWKDGAGNPAGGVSSGTGFTISWQNGPLGRCSPLCRNLADGRPLVHSVDCTRKPPNGAFVEDVIDAVIKRIEFYQDGRFACQRNENALNALHLAATELDSRTKDREARAVEGTHTE